MIVYRSIVQSDARILHCKRTAEVIALERAVAACERHCAVLLKCIWCSVHGQVLHGHLAWDWAGCVTLVMFASEHRWQRWVCSWVKPEDRFRTEGRCRRKAEGRWRAGCWAGKELHAPWKSTHSNYICTLLQVVSTWEIAGTIVQLVWVHCSDIQCMTHFNAAKAFCFLHSCEPADIIVCKKQDCSNGIWNGVWRDNVLRAM